MPEYVAQRNVFVGSRHYQAGETVTLPKEHGEVAVEAGWVSRKPGRPSAKHAKDPEG